MKSYRYEYGIADPDGVVLETYPAQVWQQWVAEGVDLYNGYSWRVRTITLGEWEPIYEAINNGQ